MATLAKLVAQVQREPTDKEILLVDDGSTDGSREWLRELGAARRRARARLPARRQPRQERCAAHCDRGGAWSHHADPGRRPRVRPVGLPGAPRADHRWPGRRRLWLALPRQQAPRAPLLAHGRQPLPHAVLEHLHQLEPDRPRDLLQGVPHRAVAVDSAARRALRFRGRGHRQDRAPRVSRVRGADLVSRSRVLGRQEDRLEGRRAGAVADPAPFRRTRRCGSHDTAPRRFTEALHPLPVVSHETVRRHSRPRDRRRDGRHQSAPARNAAPRPD